MARHLVKTPATAVRVGSGAPSNSLGEDGDSYLDFVTGYWYVRASGAYVPVPVYTGPVGPPGPVGPGNSNISGGSLTTANADFTYPAGLTIWAFEVFPNGGGSLRSLTSPSTGGAIFTLLNLSGTPVTVKQNLAGGAGGKFALQMDVDRIVRFEETVSFQWDGSFWRETGHAIPPVSADFSDGGTANQDLPSPPSPAHYHDLYTNPGGSIRSIGYPPWGAGARYSLRCGGMSPGVVTMRHLASGGAGQQLVLRNGGDFGIANNEAIDFLFDGTYWTEQSRGVPSASYGTALPSSPPDGQEHILVDSTTAPTYQLRFRYNAGASGNKWEFIGGAPMFAGPAGAMTQTGTLTPATLTSGPSLTIPRAGNYLLSFGVHAVQSGGAITHPVAQVFKNGVAVANLIAGGTGASSGDMASIGASSPLALAASDVLTISVFAAVASGTTVWSLGWIQALPQAVS